MGRYDGMISPEAAQEYFNTLNADGTGAFVLFEKSAHYPQFEEKEEFCKWMTETFK